MVGWAGHRAACTASRHQWPSAVLHVDHLTVQAPHAEMAGQWQSSETPRPTSPLTEGTLCVHCVGLGWLVKSCWTRAGLGHKSALSFFDWSASKDGGEAAAEALHSPMARPSFPPPPRRRGQPHPAATTSRYAQLTTGSLISFAFQSKLQQVWSVWQLPPVHCSGRARQLTWQAVTHAAQHCRSPPMYLSTPAGSVRSLAPSSSSFPPFCVHLLAQAGTHTCAHTHPLPHPARLASAVTVRLELSYRGLPARVQAEVRCAHKVAHSLFTLSAPKTDVFPGVPSVLAQWRPAACSAFQQAGGGGGARSAAAPRRPRPLQPVLQRCGAAWAVIIPGAPSAAVQRCPAARAQQRACSAYPQPARCMGRRQRAPQPVLQRCAPARAEPERGQAEVGLACCCALLCAYGPNSCDRRGDLCTCAQHTCALPACLLRFL